MIKRRAVLRALNRRCIVRNSSWDYPPTVDQGVQHSIIVIERESIAKEVCFLSAVTEGIL